MTNDSDARKAVRLLMDRFESLKAQSLGLALVLAEQETEQYSRLLQAADRASAAVIKPIIDADTKRNEFYAALDDPNADWSSALISMLNQAPADLV